MFVINYCVAKTKTQVAPVVVVPQVQTVLQMEQAPVQSFAAEEPELDTSAVVVE